MEKTKTGTKPAAAKKAAPKKTGNQIPYAGKVYDVLTDGTTVRADLAPAEQVSQADTGKIDLHLKSPEDVELTISKEVAKLNDGFHVVLFDAEQNKKTPREKIAILKEMVAGRPDPENPGQFIGGMTIKDKDDKAGYEQLDRVRKIAVKLRTGVGAKHKLLKENYLKVTKALDTEKNELQKLVEEIEADAEAKLKVIDEQVAEEERRIAQQKKDKLDGRVAEIKANGMEHNGGFYSIGENISLDIVTLENLDAEQYAAFLGRVKAENERIFFRKKKEEQRRRVDSYLLVRRKRAQDAEAKRLKDAADLQKRERRNDRVEALEMLDFTFNERGQYYQHVKPAGSVIVTVKQLEELEGEQWRERFRSLKLELEDLNKKQRDAVERELKNQRINARTQRLYESGFIYDQHTDSFVIKTEELGTSNCIPADNLKSDELDFNKWLSDEILPAVAYTNAKVEVIRKENAAKAERTKQRINELAAGFGIVYKDQFNYTAAPSKYSKDPELSELNGLLYTKIATVEEADEQTWTSGINALTVVLNKIRQAEEAAKLRIEKEAEEARQSLLSEKELVKEYIEKLKAITKPEIKESAFLASSLLLIDKAIKEIEQAIR